MFYAALYSGGVVSHVHNWRDEINPHFLQVNHEALRISVMGVHGPVSPAQQNTYRINTPINIPAILWSALLPSPPLSSPCPIIPPRRTSRPTRPVPSALPAYKMKMRGWSERRRGEHESLHFLLLRTIREKEERRRPQGSNWFWET